MAQDPGTSSAARVPRDLERLSALRYEVTADEPDVRGWTVYASTGREVGTVADLLVDPTAGEVVMLDVDLHQQDRHTLAPIRAAWIDATMRRVVLDARAMGDSLADATDSAAPNLPMLPRSGPLTDADIQRFDAAYVHAYGDRAADAGATWRVPRGDDEALHFAPPREFDATAGAATGIPAGGDRRTNRVDDASALDDAAGIDPRELDARVRIEEGATVDDAAPVAGVRYEGDEHTPHDYGRPDDAYGPGFGSGRIGFNKVVSREPYTPNAGAGVPDETRSVRYRQYDDRYAGPDAER